VRKGVVALRIKYKRSTYGMPCPECNDFLIAPRRSEYVSKYEVRHFWSCDNCGHRGELVGDLRINFIGHVSAPVSPLA
jgi:uncharacterized protein with PIN domain